MCKGMNPWFSFRIKKQQQKNTRTKIKQKIPQQQKPKQKHAGFP